MLAHDGTSGEGNTMTSPNDPKARIKPSKYWCFTVFNKTVNEVANELERGTSAMVLGFETCPTTGRKHIQGFCIFINRKRPLETYKAMKASWRRMSGTIREAAEYCIKEDDKPYIKGHDILFPKEYLKRDEVVSKVKQECKANKNEVYKYLYKLMFVSQRIKPISGERQQKEYCDIIYNLAFPSNGFSWLEQHEDVLDILR